MGVGAVIYDNRNEPIILNLAGNFSEKPQPHWKEVFKYNKYYPYDESGQFPITTNNVAEYLAFIEICKFLKDNVATENVILICGDSNLVIKQMSGIWGIKEGAYYDYAIKARDLFKSLPQKNVFLNWIPRELNEVADELSKLK